MLRHGESTWNAEGLWSGQADPPLTATGRTTAQRLAEELGVFAFGAVVASDLRRARETAEILAAALGLGAPTLVEGLRERQMGVWTGKTRAEIARGWPGWLDRWRQDELAELPGGETRDHFDRRVLEALLGLGADTKADRLLVVAHAGTLRALERHCGRGVGARHNLRGVWLKVQTGSLSWIGSGPS